VPINPADNDVTGYRTLAQLRSALIARLGFADALTAATRTLVDIRTSMLYLLGYGAQVASPPPGVAATINEFINQAQQALFRRLEMDKGAASAPAFMSADSDATALDGFAVQTLALAMYCAHKGKPEAKAYFEQHEKFINDTAARRPPGLVAQLNAFLLDAQLTIVRRFPGMRTERWFSWALTQGERFYALPSNYEQTNAPTSTKQLDPYGVDEVWVERGTVRNRMTQGIPSRAIAQTVTGWPSHYEIHQSIELWPAPAATEGWLRIKGSFKPTAFTADSDLPTVDDQAVYLLALANAKAHYKQPDAQLITSQFEVHLQNLVAGTHGTRRYLPGDDTDTDCVYVQPTPTVPFP